MITVTYKKRTDILNTTVKNKKHPSLDIVSASGTELSGKRIVLCISGSVAAYKAIELARLLMRHGSSSVTCVASKAATRLIRPAYLKWATGNDVITDLTGDLEHIRLADYNRSDIVIVYPATANTIGRLANGMDDAPVSTVLTVALGSKIPIVICPAMHESMYENPAVLRNIEFLGGGNGNGGGGSSSNGDNSQKNNSGSKKKKKKLVTFIGPQIIEGKAKAPEPEYVLEQIISKFAPKSSPLYGKHILLSAGPTVEYIDSVRMITNNSSGKTGVVLASHMILAGAKVTIIYGPGRHEPPKGAKIIKVETSKQMHNAIHAELKKRRFDIVIMAAAISDYTPVSTHKQHTKIKSDMSEYMIHLKKTPKTISTIKNLQKDVFLVGFKAEANVSNTSLIRSARTAMTKYHADMMIANDIGKKYQKNPNMNNVITITGPKKSDVKESGWHKKEHVVKFIKNAIEQEYSKIKNHKNNDHA